MGRLHRYAWEHMGLDNVMHAVCAWASMGRTHTLHGMYAWACMGQALHAYTCMVPLHGHATDGCMGMHGSVMALYGRAHRPAWICAGFAHGSAWGVCVHACMCLLGTITGPCMARLCVPARGMCIGLHVSAWDWHWAMHGAAVGTCVTHVHWLLVPSWSCCMATHAECAWPHIGRIKATQQAMH
eukprot:353033-Chlamydomonas_euryale.AAC.6